VVVDAEGQRKRTRPLSGVNGEVCLKSLDRVDILRDVRFALFIRPCPAN
jgi:hypothetical protein